MHEENKKNEKEEACDYEEYHCNLELQPIDCTIPCDDDIGMIGFSFWGFEIW